MAGSLRGRGGAPTQQMDEGQKTKLHESQSALAKMMAFRSLGKPLIPGKNQSPGLRLLNPSAETDEDDMEEDSGTPTNSAGVAASNTYISANRDSVNQEWWCNWCQGTNFC